MLFCSNLHTVINFHETFGGVDVLTSKLINLANARFPLNLAQSRSIKFQAYGLDFASNHLVASEKSPLKKKFEYYKAYLAKILYCNRKMCIHSQKFKYNNHIMSENTDE